MVRNVSNKLAYEIALQIIHGGKFFDQDKPLPSADEVAALVESTIDNFPGETFTPLVRGSMPQIMHKEIERMAKQVQSVSGDPLHEIMDGIKKTLQDEVWLNEIYQVNVRRSESMVHLSIKRRDKAPVTDWRHKQQIKNQLVGAECEGIELYPAESRLVDTANQYHIFVHTNPAIRIPVGWDCRLTASESTGGAKQRKL